MLPSGRRPSIDRLSSDVNGKIGTGTDMAAHPAPIQRALTIEFWITDERVPSSARECAALAEREGWTVVVQYARGNDLGEYGKVGGLVDSIVVRCSLADDALVATWLSRERRICPGCAKALMPTDSGVFRAHGIAGRKSGACDGGGQPVASAEIAEEIEYGFSTAYGRDIGRLGRGPDIAAHAEMKAYLLRRNGVPA